MANSNRGNLVSVDAAGALTGDGSTGNPLAVGVDGVTVTIVNDVLVAPTGGGGTIGGNLGATDNAVPRANGAGGATLQSSGVLISDTNVMTTLTGVVVGAGSLDAGAALVEVKATGAGTVGNTNWTADTLLVSKANANSQLGIITTDYSTDAEDGLFVYQTTEGKAFFDVGYGNVGPTGVEFIMDPLNGRIEFISPVLFDGLVTQDTTFTGAPSGVILSTNTVRYASTGGAASDAFSNVVVSASYGNDGSPGVAAIGTLQNHVSAVSVQGSGSADNEYTNYLGVVRVDIGTGYTQSTGPVGRIWNGDFSVHGSIAVQPNTLNGPTYFINNYYNGDAADSPMAGAWITTQRGSGGGNDATHAAAATYPVAVGLGITGYSNSGSDTTGFTTGIQIGGAGSPWNESKSLIGTGISISNCSGPDINLGGFIQGTEISAPSAPGANGFRLYAQDNGGGKTQLMVLFASGAAQQVAIQP